MSDVKLGRFIPLIIIGVPKLIKELKIADFTKASIAVFVFAFPTLSLAAMPNIKEILSKPGVAEQLQASNTGKNTYDGKQDTPLVVQAKKFALRINPPPPPEEIKPRIADAPVRPQAVVSAKFKLIGTSYHIGDQTQSWALVDEVGKGLHWVKQGGNVDRLVIEKIGDGSVLIDDNGRKYELLAERQNKPDVVKSYTGTLEKKEIIVLMEGGQKLTTAETVETIQPEQTTQVPAEPALTPEEQLKQTQSNIEWLKNIQSDPNSVGMSPAEANELASMGEFLKSMEAEAQQLKEQTAAKKPETTEPNNAETVPQPKPGAQPSKTETNVGPDEAPDQNTGTTTAPAKLRRIRERRH